MSLLLAKAQGDHKTPVWEGLNILSGQLCSNQHIGLGGVEWTLESIGDPNTQLLT